jgi:hypothetical protein
MQLRETMRHRAYILPVVMALVAIVGLVLRAQFAGVLLSGSWLGSVVAQERFGFRVPFIGPWIDGTLGLPLLVTMLAAFVAAIVVLSRDQDPRAAFIFLVAILISSIPTWFFPYVLLAPVAVFVLPFAAIVLFWQLISGRSIASNSETKLRAANALSGTVLALTSMDWALVFVMGGS